MTVPLIRTRPTGADLAPLRIALEGVRAACDQQMDAATSMLEALRSTGDVSDPSAQGPLMAALQALDTAERASREVGEALLRLDSP